MKDLSLFPDENPKKQEERSALSSSPLQAKFKKTRRKSALTTISAEDEMRRVNGMWELNKVMCEIGLYCYNAIHRIKEHKEQFNPQTVPDLYHVAEYYKAVDVELTCCCIQAYCKDFIFTQNEVKEIIEKGD